MGYDEGPFQNITAIGFPESGPVIGTSILYRWNTDPGPFDTVENWWRYYLVDAETGQPTYQSENDVQAPAHDYRGYVGGDPKSPYDVSDIHVVLEWESVGDPSFTRCDLLGNKLSNWEIPISPDSIPWEVGPVAIGSFAGYIGEDAVGVPPDNTVNLILVDVSDGSESTIFAGGESYFTVSGRNACSGKTIGDQSSYYFAVQQIPSGNYYIAKAGGGFSTTQSDHGFVNLLIASDDGYVYDYTGSYAYAYTTSLVRFPEKDFTVSAGSVAPSAYAIIGDYFYNSAGYFDRNGETVGTWGGVGGAFIGHRVALLPAPEE